MVTTLPFSRKLPILGWSFIIRSTTSSQFNVTGGPDEGWAAGSGAALEGWLLSDEALADTVFSAPGDVEEGNIVVAPPLGMRRAWLGGATVFSAGAWTLAGCAGGGVEATSGSTFACKTD